MALILRFPSGATIEPPKVREPALLLQQAVSGLSAAGIDAIVDLANYRFVCGPPPASSSDVHLLVRR